LRQPFSLMFLLFFNRLKQRAATHLKLLRQKRQKPGPEQLALQLDLFAPAEDPPGMLRSPGPATAALPEINLPPPAVAPGWRRLYVDEHMLDYVLQRSKRRSIGFLINDDGLRVTAPKWATITEIEKVITEKKRWIFAKLHERRERSARRLQPPMQWRDGATLPYLGQDLTLRIRAAQNAGILYDEQNLELTVCLPDGAGEQQLKDRVQGWLQTQARLLFAERLPIYAEKLNASYHSFALSSATTQWGSCTADGKIRLNWRLMHFALPMIDYVIAHELSHLREMNHGPKFWATVQSIFPEFESAKKALRDSAPETLPIF
jgi:predicted metal-dependent hydrolase